MLIARLGAVRLLVESMLNVLNHLTIVMANSADQPGLHLIEQHRRRTYTL